MKCRRLLMFASVVALSMSPAIAQEQTRLLIEVTRDGSLVAKPELRLLSGREGRLELNGEWAPTSNLLLKGLRENVVITPTSEATTLPWRSTSSQVTSSSGPRW